MSRDDNGARPRYPLPRYPTGWFFIEYSDNLGPGEVKPVKAFGQDLVLFRTEDGEAALLDAFCPHLGAHLGYGGKVSGRCISCPFHAWKFDAGGECVDVPYAKKIPPKARLDNWIAREINGMIMTWHDTAGGEPTWELPVIEEIGHPDWTEPRSRCWKVRSHNQEMAENAVDVAHFRYLHGTKDYPESSVDFGFPLMHMQTAAQMDTPRGDADGGIESKSWGFGFSTNRFTGIVETLLVATMVPIDEEFVELRFNFMVKKSDNGDLDRGVGKAFVDEVTRQVEQDIPVWENKIYVHPPVLAAGDGPVGRFRKWCKQFYPPDDLKAAEEAYYGAAKAS